MDSFSDRARDYVASQLPRAAPHSPQEIFLHLLARGTQAREAGNYGIAAALVVRYGGTETVCFGESTMFAESDPAGHAEMNALALARRIAAASSLDDELLGDRVLVRAAPHDRFERLLYSTLEPCPMCTVAILNAGIDEVVFGLADDAAGAMHDPADLPPLWGDFMARRGLRTGALSAGSEADGGVPDELLDLLRSLFFDGKDPLDERLARDGVLPSERLGRLASERRPS